MPAIVIDGILYRISNTLKSGDVVYICTTKSYNMECLRNGMSEFFIDGIFKCCPRYFYQLYNIHGCENGNYVPLLYCLLPSKSDDNIQEENNVGMTSIKLSVVVRVKRFCAIICTLSIIFWR
jgi:hypothetical protein